MQALGGVQVVEVSKFGAFGVKSGLARGGVGKRGGHVGAAHFHGGCTCAGNAGVACAEAVVIGADQDARGFVALVQGCGHWPQVASVKSHGHGQAGGFVQGGGGGVALGHQQHSGARGHADLVEVAFFDQPGGPEFFVEAFANPPRIAAPDDLQAVDVPGHVLHRDDDGTLGRVAHAVAANAFAVQVFAVALLGTLLPRFGGFLGGAGSVCFARLLGPALVFGQALAQAVTLLGTKLFFAQLDFGGVVVGAAPDTVAADDEVFARWQADLMQVIPAALFAVAAIDFAAAQAANVNAIYQQASALQLAQNIIVVGCHQ